MKTFHQLFEPDTSTYTYILVDPTTDAAAIIDPAKTMVERDLRVIRDHGLRLELILDTHVHADHITGAGDLRRETGAPVAVGRECGADCADFQLDGDEDLTFGNEVIHTIATPGHTPGSMSFRWRDRVFTGDALLIGGTGRTDFQGGDPGQLWDSLTQGILSLDDETLLFPGHDYEGRTVTTVGEERATNPRLAGNDREGFIALMNGLDLNPPRYIDESVPANRRCGDAA
ncbi:MBL fold metallo-hydrolase [Thiohalospira sp.]|uniref:MBL fold metallo-hydrolase n=1 Tax=Thiohalospira sp. TaxID=3080549 RepID=UPI00397F8F07